MEDGDGDGDGNRDGDGDGDGGGLIKQSYAASSLKLHVYWTINQNLQNISLSKLQHHLNFRLKETNVLFN
jgi:hypothetical protein